MDAAVTLAWMRDHGGLLRHLVMAEGFPEEGDPPPASDPGIRAHLRFLAAALAATADHRYAPLLDDFPGALPDYFADGEELFARHLAQGEGAIALETHLQLRGGRPGVDPSFDIALQRRIHLFGWIRLFLLAFEEHVGQPVDGIADRVVTWFDVRQRELGRLIVSLDLQAQAAAREAHGGPLDAEAIDALGQAVLVQAYVRQLTLGVCAVLDEDSPPTG